MVVHRIRTHLPIQGTQVCLLVWEHSTCHEAYRKPSKKPSQKPSAAKNKINKFLKVQLEKKKDMQFHLYLFIKSYLNK